MGVNKQQLGKELQEMKKKELIMEVFKREWQLYELRKEVAFLKGRTLLQRLWDTQMPL